MTCEILGAKRVGIVGHERKQIIRPRSDVCLTHSELDLLVEEIHHRHRSRGPAVDADQRHRPAAANGVDGRVEYRRTVGPDLFGQRRSDPVRKLSDHGLHGFHDRCTVRLHADGVDHGVRAPTRRRLDNLRTGSPSFSQSITSAP